MHDAMIDIKCATWQFCRQTSQDKRAISSAPNFSQIVAKRPRIFRRSTEGNLKDSVTTTGLTSCTLLLITVAFGMFGNNGVEPWRSIDVVEGLAPPHLVDVGAGVEIVGIDERAGECSGDTSPDYRLAGSGNAHHDDGSTDHLSPAASGQAALIGAWCPIVAPAASRLRRRVSRP